MFHKVSRNFLSATSSYIEKHIVMKILISRMELEITCIVLKSHLSSIHQSFVTMLFVLNGYQTNIINNK